MTVARSQSGKGLGKAGRRGLGAGLLGQGQGSNVGDLLPHLELQPEAGGEALREVPVGLVDRSPYQPRTVFDPEKLRELADSITASGVLQPILVRPRSGGRFELVAGERRLEASKLAGRPGVLARVREVDDLTAATIALTENLQRENLSPWEEAQGLARLRGTLAAASQPATVRDLARAIGWSKSKVGRALQIAEGVPVAALELAGVPVPSRDKLPERTLVTAAAGETLAEKARLLRSAIGEDAPPHTTTPRGRHAAGAMDRRRAAYHLERRPDGRFRLDMHTAPEELTPAKARALLDELAPVLAALRQRARATR